MSALRWLWLGAAAAAACDPVWSLRALVRSPSGAPLAGAALAITCPGGGKAALSDAEGRAEIGGLGWEPPAGCEITVARPGHRTHRTSFEALCAPRAIDDCHRARSLEVTLEESVGAR